MDAREPSQADAPASDSMEGGRRTGEDRTPCPDCMGTGRRENEECATCSGTGFAPEESAGGG